MNFMCERCNFNVLISSCSSNYMFVRNLALIFFIFSLFVCLFPSLTSVDNLEANKTSLCS